MAFSPFACDDAGNGFFYFALIYRPIFLIELEDLSEYDGNK